MNESRGAVMATSHDISVKNRTKMSITGVVEVISFDEAAVSLKTICGEMTVEGEGLHIGVLDTERGLVALEGTSIDGIFYLRADGGEKKGLFGRWRRT